MSGRSTKTNLDSFMPTSSNVFCDRGQRDIIYFGLSKTFEFVDHGVIIRFFLFVSTQPHLRIREYFSAQANYVPLL